MIGVVTRKTFWDFWDNIVAVFVGNLGLAVALFGLVLGFEEVASFGLAASVAALAAGTLGFVVLLAVYAVILGLVIRRAEYHAPTVRRAVIAVVPGALLIGLTSLGLAGVLGLLLLWTDGAVAPLRFAVLIGTGWLALLWLQIALFLLPALAATDGDIAAAVKRAAVLVLDNAPFSAAVTAFGLFLLPFMVMIVPGPGAALILFDNALTLRSRKYTGADPRRVDWETLLAEERRALARRTPRSILFPWRS